MNFLEKVLLYIFIIEVIVKRVMPPCVHLSSSFLFFIFFRLVTRHRGTTFTAKVYNSMRQQKLKSSSSYVRGITTHKEALITGLYSSLPTNYHILSKGVKLFYRQTHLHIYTIKY